MTVINTNTAAINAQYNLSRVQSEQENAMERLSSGLRINSASDDAAGVAIASRMNAEITGTNMAIRNALDSQAMIDTAEGAHVEVESILQRMRELSVQSANDTYSDTDRANLQAELSQLQTEVDRIAMATNWGGKNLLNGTSLSSPAPSHSETKNLQFQVGTGSAMVNTIDVKIGAISSAALGVGVGSASAKVSSSGVSASTAEAPASISIDGGKVTISGKPQVGDIFKFDVNGEEISVTYSVSDEFTDDLAGLSSQMKAALETKINNSAVAPSLANVSVVDNQDGSITLSQSTTPNIDNIVNSDTNNNSDVAIDGNVVRMSGTFEASDTFGVSINGVAIAITATTTDAYTDDFSGLSAQLKAAIDGNATLNGTVTAVDNKDGSVSIVQSTSPVIQAAETTLAKTQSATLSFGSAVDSGIDSVMKITETAAPVAGDMSVTTFTDGTNTLTLSVKSTGTTAGDHVTAIKNAFDSLTTADQKGFSMSLDATTNELSVSRADSVDFSVAAANNNASIVEIGAAAAVDHATAQQVVLEKADGDTLVVTAASAANSAQTLADKLLTAFNAIAEADRKGFSAVAVGASGSETGIQFSRADGAAFDVYSNTDDITHDAGNNTALAAYGATLHAPSVITFDNGDAANPLTDGDGLSIVLGNPNFVGDTLTYTTASATVASWATDAFAFFNPLTDKMGYSFELTSATELKVTRLDGALFTATTTVTDNDGGSSVLQVGLDGAAPGAATDGTAQSATNAGDIGSASKATSTPAAQATNLEEDATSATTTTAIGTTASGLTSNGHKADNNEVTLTFGGGYVSGKEYSADILGHTVSIVAKDDDGFENSLNGLANQMTQAINDAGISGIKAQTSTNFVAITSSPELANGEVVKDQVSSGQSADASITLATDRYGQGKVTLGGAITSGDEFKFDVNGTTVNFKIAADGFSDTDLGIATQLKEAIENAGITGLTVAVDGSNRAVTINMDLTTATNLKSTTVTNVGVADTATATLKVVAKDGSFSVSGEVSKGDKFDFSVEGQSFTVSAGADGAELSAKGVANQMANMVMAANIASLEIAEDGNGSVSFSTTDVKITDSQSAKDSIAVIDAAIETINKQRANLGGVSNRLDNTVTNLSNVSANLQSSLSRIQDADFATETSNLTKSQILSQAATAMLAQANASKQGVLSLLQG